MPRSLRLLQKNWDGLAAFDAKWAVLTHADKKGRQWRDDEFFETGEREISETMATWRSLGAEPRRGMALDFGCGVGRLTRALARHFDQAWGTDISSAMIRQASDSEGVPRNCQFRLNERLDLALFESASFDFVYSSIVLQHMKRAAAEAYISEFCRVLAPGGLMVLQMPDRPLPTMKGLVMRLLNTPLLRPIWNLYRRLRSGNLYVMEMHGIPPARVCDVLNAKGVAVRYIAHDHSAGPDWASYRYFCSKLELAKSPS